MVKKQYSVKLCGAVTKGHIDGSGHTIQNPKPGGGWEKKRKKLLTAMCQASETSEWKGSVEKEVAGVDDQAGQEGKKSEQRKIATRLFGTRFLAQQSVAHADSGEATQRPS